MFYEYQLWTFDSFMGDSFTCLLIKDLIYPPAVILFLTHYPEGAVKRIVYISGWAAAGTLLEFIAFLLSGIYYDHGWNIWWSFALLVIAFALVRLHYRKPLLVWLPSLACGIAVSFIFGLPFPR
jgi:hypothetical protein